MEILIGVALGVALLYFWLLAHWFARVLVFLLAAPCLGFILATIMPPWSVTPHADLNPLGFLIGFVAGWWLAAAPTYYWRGQLILWQAKAH